MCLTFSQRLVRSKGRKKFVHAQREEPFLADGLLAKDHVQILSAAKNEEPTPEHTALIWCQFPDEVDRAGTLDLLSRCSKDLSRARVSAYDIVHTQLSDEPLRDPIA